ncbi:hypothetical protein Tco_0501049, partial [Tanacetum coccineum]
LVAKQVTVLVYYELGGSRVPSSMSHKILLHDALYAFCVLSSMVVAG